MGGKSTLRTRQKKPSKKKLIKLLDGVFSQFIRCRDADRHTGLSWCRTCGASGRWQDFQCGHWIKRYYLGTRWREENCNTQCGTCNGIRRGAEHEHAAYIAKTYGAPMLDELLSAKRTSLKLNSGQIESMLEDYKQKLAELE